jgi:hypothetical protein
MNRRIFYAKHVESRLRVEVTLNEGSTSGVASLLGLLERGGTTVCCGRWGGVGSQQRLERVNVTLHS